MNHSTVSASTASAQTFSIKKTALAGMLVALTVALSGFSIPIGASKCFPIQHLVNVLAGVFLGPVYGVSMAFCVSLIRNILGTGSLLAFPGSMVGAFLGAYLFQKTGRFLLACCPSDGKGCCLILLRSPIPDEYRLRNRHCISAD